MTKQQIQFIIDSDVEDLVSFLIEDFSINTDKAFDTVYNSKTYEKLINADTGLYIQSASYIYEYLKEEIGESGNKRSD